MKALLICDNKDEWQDFKSVTDHAFPSLKITTVREGKTALEHLTYNSTFAIVIVDTTLEENPIQLANRILQQVGDRPILFIGPEKIVTHRVISHAITKNNKYFIPCPKPYNVEKLKEIMSAPLKWIDDENSDSIFEIDKDKFLPIKLRNFFLFDNFAYDAYIELTKTKFMKVIAKNIPYSRRFIRSMVQKNVKYLYLEKTNYIRFLEESIFKAMSLLQDKSLPSEQLIQVQISSILIIHQYIRDIGVSESLMALAGETINISEKIFDECQSCAEILKIFPTESMDTSEKSILTLYICRELFQGHGWSSDSARQRLGLAAILHDCMIRNEELIDIQSADSSEFHRLSNQLQKSFLEHPIKAAELANQFTGYSNVEFIIHEHHEMPDGSGFPLKKKANRLTYISCVFILASNFTHQMAIKGISKSSIKTTLEQFDKIFNVGNFKPSLELLKRNFSNAL